MDGFFMVPCLCVPVMGQCCTSPRPVTTWPISPDVYKFWCGFLAKMLLLDTTSAFGSCWCFTCWVQWGQLATLCWRRSAEKRYTVFTIQHRHQMGKQQTTLGVPLPIFSLRLAWWGATCVVTLHAVFVYLSVCPSVCVCPSMSIDEIWFLGSSHNLAAFPFENKWRIFSPQSHFLLFWHFWTFHAPLLPLQARWMNPEFWRSLNRWRKRLKCVFFCPDENLLHAQSLLRAVCRIPHGRKYRPQMMNGFALHFLKPLWRGRAKTSLVDCLADRAMSSLCNTHSLPNSVQHDFCVNSKRVHASKGNETWSQRGWNKLCWAQQNVISLVFLVELVGLNVAQQGNQKGGESGWTVWPWAVFPPCLQPHSNGIMDELSLIVSVGFSDPERLSKVWISVEIFITSTLQLAAYLTRYSWPGNLDLVTALTGSSLDYSYYKLAASVLMMRIYPLVSGVDPGF